MSERSDPAEVLRIGVDIGGTKCLGVALDAQGHVRREVRRPTPRGSDAVLTTLLEVIDALGSAGSIGVGIAGLVNRSGVLVASPNLPGVRDLEVAALIGREIGRPITVDNDATCATFAEWQLGAGRGAQDLVLVTLGTGIGGGMVAGGELLRGHHGFAGEYGHMVVDPEGPLCVCGQRGCWERYASGAGLAHLAREAVRRGRGARIVAIAGGEIDAVRGEHVQLAAREADPDAVAIVDEFGRWVAIGLVNLANLLDPELFIIGGGLTGGGDVYAPSIRRWFAELRYGPTSRPLPPIEFAALDERAGAVGAALLGADPVGSAGHGAERG